jgi:amino acid transporter
VPWHAGTLTAWAVIAVLGTRRIDLTGRLLAVLLIAEVTVMIGYDAVLLTHPHGGHPQTGPLSPTQLLAPGGLLALVAVAASFTGIELPTVLGEEAKNPHHTTGRATRTAVLLTGTLYTISAWALPVATGPDHIQQAAREHGPLLLFTLITPHTPAPLVQAGQVLLLTSVFAAALAFHTTSTRYLFALAREHILPARLGTVSRTGAPTPASLLHSLGTLTALTAYTATGAHVSIPSTRRGSGRHDLCV